MGEDDVQKHLHTENPGKPPSSFRAGELNVIKQPIYWAIFGVMFLAAVWLGYLGWQSFRQASVIVEWSTASELDTAGFALFRSESPTGEYMRVNTDIIPASTDPLTGGSYQYEDRQVVAGQTYYYQLEEVEFSGQTTRFGPIEVVAERGGKVELLAACAIGLVAIWGLINTAVRWRSPEALRLVS